MQLLTTDQYYDELLERLPQARHRIVLAAMVVTAGPNMGRIFEAAEAALARGVSVHILADIYTKTRFAPSNRPGLQTAGGIEAWFARLTAAGARVSWVGERHLNPFKGHCHIKASVIDDRAYTFGGVNLSDDSFENIDYMLAADNAALATKLEELVNQISSGQLGKAGISWPLAGMGTALVDSGTPKQSVIYDRACQLASQAKSVLYVSQMVPSGRLAAAFARTDTSCFYNRISTMAFPDSLGARLDQRVGHVTNQYQRQRYIHAKFILFELKDGTKALISGSNNFSWRGVKYGTQEIALESTDANLWQALHEFWQREVQ